MRQADRDAVQLRERGIVGDAEEIGQYAAANFIEEGILRLGIAHAQRGVHHGLAHAQQVGQENRPEELRRRSALCQNRAVVALNFRRRPQILEALAERTHARRQRVTVRQPIERLRVKRRRILKRSAVRGLRVGVGVEGYARFLARVPRALAVHVAHIGIYRGKTDARSIDVRHGTEKRGKVARLGLPLCAIHVNGRSRDGGLCGSFLGEVGNSVGVDLVFESRAFLGKVLDGFLVGGVGYEPDLPPQLVVIVVERQFRGAVEGLHHAGHVEGEGKEVCVVELVATHADFHGDAPPASLIAGVERAEAGRNACAFRIDHAIGDEVGLLKIFELQLLHGAIEFVVHGLHHDVVLCPRGQSGGESA